MGVLGVLSDNGRHAIGSAWGELPGWGQYVVGVALFLWALSFAMHTEYMRWTSHKSKS